MRRLPYFAAALFLLVPLASGCSPTAPAESHVDPAYRGKLPDDVMVEASTTVLVTTKDVVIAVDCRPLAAAIANGDAAAIDAAVAKGTAAKLGSNVRLYTPPFSNGNSEAAPVVVTDDKYSGVLCTPDGYKVVKS